MSLFTRKPSALPPPEEALPAGRPIPVVANHLVLGTPLVPPFPEASSAARSGGLLPGRG